MMKVSVIIPVYNASLYLRKCLDSVINQTYSNLEIILVDDGSLDNSYRIMEEYKSKDKRFKIYHKENSGVAKTRNFGLSKATGDYISFVDSDDYVELDYIEYLVSIIGNNDLAICGHKKFVNDKETFLFKEEILNLNQEEAYKYLLDLDNNFTLSVWAKLYKKELLKDISFPDCMIFEDIEVVDKVLEKTNRIIYSTIPKYNYVIRYGSLSFSDYQEDDKNRNIYTKKMVDKIIKKYPSLKNAAIIFYISSLIATCNKMLFVNKKDKLLDDATLYIKKNMKVVLFSKIKFMKKIQILLFCYNKRWYKKIYKKIKKDDVL